MKYLLNPEDVRSDDIDNEAYFHRSLLCSLVYMCIEIRRQFHSNQLHSYKDSADIDWFLEKRVEI